MTWDCKYRTEKDKCQKRKSACLPGGKDCVLGEHYEFPLRKELGKVNRSKLDKKG